MHSSKSKKIVPHFAHFPRPRESDLTHISGGFTTVWSVHKYDDSSKAVLHYPYSFVWTILLTLLRRYISLHNL